MSIIEQAAKRLEELNRAGVEVPWKVVDGSSGVARPDVVGLVRPARLAEAPRVANVAPMPLPVADDAPPRVDIVLDIEGLQRAGQLVPTDTRSVQAEELRSIKRPLLKNARSKNAAAQRLPLIMVTSALPGEGKTFFSINLAMSIATEIDLSVLLVDADVLRQDAMERLGVGPGPGLLDLLSDSSVSLQDVVLQTNVPKLSILRAGYRQNLSTELLASSAMDKLLHKLAHDHPRQIVVFDAPPLLITNQAKVLAAHLGQVVVLVEASRTQRHIVQQAFAALEQCPIVMSVLNKSSEQPSGGGYGYGYGYGA
jgi:receptor protein-tyrosine kinase